MTQSTKNTLRIIGTAMMIVGALAFIAGLIIGGSSTLAGKILVYGGAAVLAIGLIIDSLADGGIFIVFRLVGGTTGPGENPNR